MRCGRRIRDRGTTTTGTTTTTTRDHDHVDAPGDACAALDVGAAATCCPGRATTLPRRPSSTARPRSASSATSLAPLDGVRDLAFDLVARRVTIAHTLADAAPLAAAIRGVGMRADEVARRARSTARRCRGGCSCTTVARRRAGRRVRGRRDRRPRRAVAARGADGGRGDRPRRPRHVAQGRPGPARPAPHDGAADDRRRRSVPSPSVSGRRRPSSSGCSASPS